MILNDQFNLCLEGKGVGKKKSDMQHWFNYDTMLIIIRVNVSIHLYKLAYLQAETMV